MEAVQQGSLAAMVSNIVMTGLEVLYLWHSRSFSHFLNLSVVEKKKTRDGNNNKKTKYTLNDNDSRTHVNHPTLMTKMCPHKICLI